MQTAFLTPAATDQAPKGHGSTGKPVFNGMWTLLGVPAVSVPMLTGADGMPIGVQVVGRHGADAQLLRSAKWLWERFGGQGE